MLCICNLINTGNYIASSIINNFNSYNQTGGSYIKSCLPEYCHKPKFKVGQRIVYYTYMLKTWKIAIHDIIDIKDSYYICKNEYYPDEPNKFKIIDTDKTHMELKECLDKFPEYFIKGTFNNPHTRI